MRHATGGNLDKVKRVVKLVGFVCCTGIVFSWMIEWLNEIIIDYY